MIKNGTLGIVFIILFAVASELVSTNPFTDKIQTKAWLLILLCSLYYVFYNQLFTKFFKDKTSQK
ncbi:hypothetical protein [Dokdonia sp. Hel_I_53]|uniref:hypothetical protein n=1 Tax=Dokdonia sp. Hel_I_53 TaxID=1566287 RepID=UPI00119C0289|nr:hypothetical protein [Dokdonia sp. Hel_I_53]TVZ52538.1 hypothetical protein OD90_1715 [Dokdonia sp. Hel_I_53]